MQCVWENLKDKRLTEETLVQKSQSILKKLVIRGYSLSHEEMDQD